MTTSALRHFVERALGTYADDLTEWFPGCFHWGRLCADVPSMVARAEGRAHADDDLEADAALCTRAERVFSHAYVTSLAVLAAAGGEDADPEATLEMLADVPDDAEEAYFESLAVDVLGPVEEHLAGESVELDARGEQALELVDLAWPFVQELLAEGGLREEDPPEEHAAKVHAVLMSVALVAAVLAAFRWLSVGREPTPAGESS